MLHESKATPGEGGWDQQRLNVGRQFVRDMEGLWSEVLKLAAVVEEALDKSIRDLCDGCVTQADLPRLRQPAVDRWEIRIERECVQVLALYQPVASDLRRVAAVLRINGDLKRLGELARHIAKRHKKLARDPRAFPILQPLENLALEALNQVHNSLDALTQTAAAGARAVIAADQKVDRHYRAVLKLIKQEIVREPDRINTWLRFINTARNLERVADHASKIAEAVVYLEEGEMFRNQGSMERGNLP